MNLTEKNHVLITPHRLFLLTGIPKRKIKYQLEKKHINWRIKQNNIIYISIANARQLIYLYPQNWKFSEQEILEKLNNFRP